MICMFLSSFIFFALKSAMGFQSQAFLPATSMSRNGITQRGGGNVHSSLATTSSTVLHAKFKLDNEIDWEEDENNSMYSSSSSSSSSSSASSLQTFGDDEEDILDLRKNMPTTTFGSEAVPMEQRPANEYLNLLSAPFFDWANRPSGNAALGIRLGVLYAVLFGAVCWPISGATFTADGYLFHKILSSHIGALGFILIFCLRLYSGWGYVGGRLTSKEIEFEETGW
jgi:Protein of unknown function (DUF1230).